MSATPDFRPAGLWIALVTPFTADGDVDHPALARLVRRLAADGVDGFVACGSTGEAASLDLDEHAAVLDNVLGAAGALPVAMGVGGSNLRAARHALKTLGDRPVAAWLLAAPHYIRPCQEGLRQWFFALADTAPGPVLAYDIPYRTGSTLTLETLRAIGSHPNIVGVKDCGGDMTKTRALVSDGNLAVLAGEDSHAFAHLAEGGAGAISACAHVDTSRWVAWVNALRTQNDLTAARDEWQRLAPAIPALLAEPNPAVIKAVLAHQGQMLPNLRMPMQRASEAALNAALAVLQPKISNAPTK